MIAASLGVLSFAPDNETARNVTPYSYSQSIPMRTSAPPICPQLCWNSFSNWFLTSWIGLSSGISSVDGFFLNFPMHAECHWTSVYSTLSFAGLSRSNMNPVGRIHIHLVIMVTFFLLSVTGCTGFSVSVHVWSSMAAVNRRATFIRTFGDLGTLRIVGRTGLRTALSDHSSHCRWHSC